MIGIVSTFACRIGERQDACDGSAASAQYPTGHQAQKDFGTRLGENPEKLAKKLWPCRKYTVHIDLPVLTLNPIKTSDGRYVLVDKPLKYVA